MNIQTAIKKLIALQDLTEDEISTVMNDIMSGNATSAQIAGFLVALQMKGETVTELYGAATILRKMVTPVIIHQENAVDIVGTGGDSANTFNISTTSAFVVAAAGGTVLKHGNRSVSGRSGSADVLETAGINLNLTAEQVKQCVEKLGIGFMFAPNYHPAMKQVAQPRKELGIRTLFNLLGPLINPANVRNIVCGVYHHKWLFPIAQLLQRLNFSHAMVVHSVDGLDELSVAAPTEVVELKNNALTDYTLDPKAFGFEVNSLAEITIANAQESLQFMHDVFANKKGSARDIVLLNAGAAIYVAGLTSNLAQGIQLAEQVIANGQAQEKFQQLISYTQEFKDGKTN